jgi:ketosteroid isomerase-like protein
VSQDDLDLVRGWFDAWNIGDMETFLATFDADAEVITDPSFPEAGPLRGRQAIRDFFDGVKESWEGQDQAVVKELFEAGDNVVARWDWTARGRASGMETGMDWTTVYDIENAKIVRLRYYRDHASALRAMGLAG